MKIVILSENFIIATINATRILLVYAIGLVLLSPQPLVRRKFPVLRPIKASILPDACEEDRNYYCTLLYNVFCSMLDMVAKATQCKEGRKIIFLVFSSFFSDPFPACLCSVQCETFCAL